MSLIIDNLEAQNKLKDELFLFDPEQTNDLVFVPLAEDIAVFLSGLFATGEVGNYSVDSRWVNLPFSVNVTNTGRLQPSTFQAFLFQRFNDKNKPFADNYSKKLFDFYYQFANHYILSRASSSFARTVNSKVSGIDRNIDLFSLKNSHYYGNRTVTNRVSNGLNVELSYYVAKRIEQPIQLYYFARYYDYPRHRNNCISVPYSREWFLQFSVIFPGSSYTLNHDILVGSLVVDFIDNPELNLYWSEQDKQNFLSQIPDYYLYDNIDNFFSELTSEIESRIPHVYEELEYLKSSKSDLVFSFENSFTVTPTNKIYEQSTLDLRAGMLIYGNNNKWGNTYNWIDSNESTIYSDFSEFVNLLNETERANIYDENGNFLEQIDRLTPRFLVHGAGASVNDRPFFYILNQTVRSYKEGNITFNQQSRISNSLLHFSGAIAPLIYDSMISVQFVQEKGSKTFDGDYIKTGFYYYNYSYIQSITGGTGYESSAFETVNNIFTNSDLQGQQSLNDISFNNVDTNTMIFATEPKILFDNTYKNELSTVLREAHKRCYKTCPLNTCTVDCGDYLCCYGSDGVAVDYFDK